MRGLKRGSIRAPTHKTSLEGPTPAISVETPHVRLSELRGIVHQVLAVPILSAEMPLRKTDSQENLRCHAAREHARQAVFGTGSRQRPSIQLLQLLLLLLLCLTRGCNVPLAGSLHHPAQKACPSGTPMASPQVASRCPCPATSIRRARAHGVGRHKGAASDKGGAGDKGPASDKGTATGAEPWV